LALTLQHEHPWDIAPKEAVQIQLRLRRHVITEGGPSSLQRVAGIDCGFEQNGAITRAAVAVLSYPDLTLVDRAIARVPTTFPYVPGLLSFREIPAVLAALTDLSHLPDLLLVDGQGFAHPRRFGIACHLGVLTGLPTIGVAKTRLCGIHDEPPLQRGSWTPLMDGAERIGAVLRTRSGVAPVFVSTGHRIGLEAAVATVMSCVTRYRLPETTRWAHRLASG
jgi:deoxyribonuclease V